MSAAKTFPSKQFIIFLYGYPGAGKTAFARQLAEDMNLAHLQQDKLAQELYGENNEKTYKAARSAMNYMSREFLRTGASVVFDTEVYRVAERRALREAVRKAKAIPVLVWLQIDPETAYNRGQKRDRRMTDNHYAKKYSPSEFKAVMERMQNPDNEDYVVISGKHTFNTQKAAVYKKFYDLGILNPAQLSQNTVKPGLINLVPQNNSRGDVARRNINIR